MNKEILDAVHELDRGLAAARRLHALHERAQSDAAPVPRPADPLRRGLEALDQGLAALLSLAAYFAPDDLPLALFQQPADLYPQALAALGRNGVPVYVLYRPGKEPLLLPEVLRRSTMQEALAAL